MAKQFISDSEMGQLEKNGEAIVPDFISDNETEKYFGSRTQPRFAPTQETANITAEGQQAQEFLKKPWYKQLFTKRTAQELPGAAAKVAAETPAKFLASAAEVPGILRRGKAGIEQGKGLAGYAPTQKEYPLAGKSYISEASTRAGEIVEGKKPLYTALAPFAEVPLAAAETVGLAKGIGKGTKILGKGLAALKPQSYKKLLAEVTDRKISEATQEAAQAIASTEAKTAVQGAAKAKTLAISVSRKAKDLELAKQVRKDYNLPESWREAHQEIEKQLPVIGKQLDEISSQSGQKINWSNIQKGLEEIANQKKAIGQEKASNEIRRLASRLEQGNKYKQDMAFNKAVALKRQLDGESYAISQAAQRGEKITGSKEIYQKAADLFRKEIHQVSPEMAKLDQQFSSYSKIKPDLKKLSIAEEIAEQTLKAEAEKASAITITARDKIEKAAASKIKSLQAELVEAIKKEKIMARKRFKNIVTGSAITAGVGAGVGYGVYRLFNK